jgi:hypothetical protein
MKCPFCRNEFESKPKNTWKFRFYEVKYYTCPKCKKGINVYSAPGKKTWTIPKMK